MGCRRTGASGPARSTHSLTRGLNPSGYEWRYDADRQAIEIVRRRSAIFQIHALAGKQHYTVSSSTQDSATGGDGEGSGGGNSPARPYRPRRITTRSPRSKAS